MAPGASRSVPCLLPWVGLARLCPGAVGLAGARGIYPLLCPVHPGLGVLGPGASMPLMFFVSLGQARLALVLLSSSVSVSLFIFGCEIFGTGQGFQVGAACRTLEILDDVQGPGPGPDLKSHTHTRRGIVVYVKYP